MNLGAKNKTALLFSSAVAITFCGVAYSIVPLYKLICQNTGINGAPQIADSLDRKEITPNRLNEPVSIKFVANKSKNLPWKFKPLQNRITLFPGQTALAFYNAENQSDKDIIGFATYNIVPARAALYFNKIQCFCFEEQQLGGGESVEMPVFFYIDPEFNIDPVLKGVKEIILSYTFFENKDQK